MVVELLTSVVTELRISASLLVPPDPMKPTTRLAGWRPLKHDQTAGCTEQLEIRLHETECPLDSSNLREPETTELGVRVSYPMKKGPWVSAEEVR